MKKQAEIQKVTKHKKHGVQAKTKTSTSKTSKNYKKTYKGQGR